MPPSSTTAELPNTAHAGCEDLPPVEVRDAEPRDIIDADKSNIGRRESRAIHEVRSG